MRSAWRVTRLPHARQCRCLSVSSSGAASWRDGRLTSRWEVALVELRRRAVQRHRAVGLSTIVCLKLERYQSQGGNEQPAPERLHATAIRMHAWHLCRGSAPKVAHSRIPHVVSAYAAGGHGSTFASSADCTAAGRFYRMPKLWRDRSSGTCRYAAGRGRPIGRTHRSPPQLTLRNHLACIEARKDIWSD